MTNTPHHRSDIPTDLTVVRGGAGKTGRRVAGDCASNAGAIRLGSRCCALYKVTGPRLLTLADAVGEIAAAAGREIRYVPITAEQFATGMLEQGVPRDFAVALAELMVTVLHGRNSSVTDGVHAAIGRAPTSPNMQEGPRPAKPGSRPERPDR
jgi:hypothetical protein